MEVSSFVSTRTNHVKLSKLCHEWIGLVVRYRHDAVPELSKIYEKLCGNAVDADTVSNDCGILHSSRHVYIYRFDLFQLVHYGNDCKRWPVEDKSLWPWCVAEKEPPRMVRDVWNLIFAHLSPFDILSVGRVNTQLREYAHGVHAWKRYISISTDWRYYTSLLDGSSNNKLICFFLRHVCIPHEYRNVKILTGTKQDGTTYYRIGNLFFEKGPRKRSYMFRSGQLTATIKYTLPLIRSRVISLLKTHNLKTCSPLEGWPNLPTILRVAP